MNLVYNSKFYWYFSRLTGVYNFTLTPHTTGPQPQTNRASDYTALAHESWPMENFKTIKDVYRKPGVTATLSSWLLIKTCPSLKPEYMTITAKNWCIILGETKKHKKLIASMTFFGNLLSFLLTYFSVSFGRTTCADWHPFTDSIACSSVVWTPAVKCSSRT